MRSIRSPPPTRPRGCPLILRPPSAAPFPGNCVLATLVRLASFRSPLPGSCHGFCSGTAAAAGPSLPPGSGRPDPASPGSGNEEGVPCSLPLLQGAGAEAPAALPAAARATVGVRGGLSGQGGGEGTQAAAAGRRWGGDLAARGLGQRKRATEAAGLPPLQNLSSPRESNRLGNGPVL